MPESDAEIVRRARKGDLNAYGVLIDRYQQRLVAAAQHLLGNGDEARDAVQETFIEAYRHIDQLREPERLGGWLYGILRHRVHALLTRRRTCLSWEDEMAEDWYVQPGPDEGYDMPELLTRLPAVDREALAARYIMDLSYEEVAALLKTTPQNARVRVCRAKERLRALLARAEEEVEP